MLNQIGLQNKYNQHNVIDKNVAQCYIGFQKGGMNMINTFKIKGRMAEMGITQKDIASSLHVAPPTVSQKINNIRPMDLNEAEELAKMLKITDDDFAVYFFSRNVAQRN